MNRFSLHFYDGFWWGVCGYCQKESRHYQDYDKVDRWMNRHVCKKGKPE